MERAADDGAVAGLSDAASAPARDLHALASTIAASSSARTVLDSGALDLIDALEGTLPESAAALRTYLTAWGDHAIGYDPGLPTLREQPELLAGLIRDQLDAPPPTDLLSQRAETVKRARGALRGNDLLRFDDALAFAELIYPQREDNIVLTDKTPTGLVRRAALEVGRRLVERGALDAADSVLFIEYAELKDGLRGRRSDLLELARRRRAEIAWVRANPGPATYGSPSTKTPDVRGLPEPARRINGALLWAMDAELKPAVPQEDGGLGGIGASAGRYRGRVRVIRSANQLDTLERGEILVCPIITPAWAVFFSRAGALVTDGGSVLSHAAVIAREHGVPAVVATATATSTLRDGQEISVDGTTGMITLYD